jgi:hypothetical protein
MKSLCLVLTAFVMFSGCGGPGKKAVMEWTMYQDPYFPCSFQYPQGWHAMNESEKVAIYSHQEGAQKFFDPSTKGEGGSQLMISFERSNDRSLESALNTFRDEMTASGFVLQSTDARTIGELPAYLVTYTGRFDERTRLTGVRLITIRDSVLYFLGYAGFDDSYDVYQASFDTLCNSFVFPKPRVADKNVDPSLPSDRFISYSSDLLSISYPDNFEPTLPAPKGEVTFSLELKGYRQDCTIRIDVFPAKGLTLEKVFEQNGKFYKATAAGDIAVNGVPFRHLRYSPAKGIESRVFFGVKNDKVWRIISNVYQPLKAKLNPAFEQTIQSLRIK